LQVARRTGSRRAVFPMGGEPPQSAKFTPEGRRGRRASAETERAFPLQQWLQTP